MSIEQQILAIGKKARAAAVYMAKANTHAKNAALLETAKLIRANKAQLTQGQSGRHGTSKSQWPGRRIAGSFGIE
jgi:gamma-glutamyl phosphate reductase